MENYVLGDTILSVENVSKSFGGKKILNNVTFDIKDIIRENMTQGQIVSLIGKSGIGKTVLFNCLAGFLAPDKGGSITLNGEKVTSGSVGVVPQNYILFNHYTIQKNLELALKKGSGDKAYMKDLVERFDLTQHLLKYPAQLSGGQKQRVSILQQILAGHNFILCDEPYASLDSINIARVNVLLKEVANLDEKNTILIISHDIESVLSISDRALLMKKISDEDGARITDIYDLAGMGLAWSDNLEENNEFRKLVLHVKHNL